MRILSNFANALTTQIRKADSLSTFQVLAIGLTLAAVLELLTIAVRFGIGFTSTAQTAFLSPLTFGLRIHHGYFGVIAFLVAVTVFRSKERSKHRGIFNGLMIVAIGLAGSDLIHHFLILWPLTGSPQFDLVYPAAN